MRLSPKWQSVTSLSARKSGDHINIDDPWHPTFPITEAPRRSNV
jgi:hypothetical protein